MIARPTSLAAALLDPALPIGVIYDALACGSMPGDRGEVLDITIRSSSALDACAFKYPADSSVSDAFLHAVKQSVYTRCGHTRPFTALSSSDIDALYSGAMSGDSTRVIDVRKRLAEDGDASRTRVPVRVIIPRHVMHAVRPVGSVEGEAAPAVSPLLCTLQRPVPVTASLQEAVSTCVGVGDAWEGALAANVGETVCHGWPVAPARDVNVDAFWRAMSHPDGFLYIIVQLPRGASAAAASR